MKDPGQKSEWGFDNPLKPLGQSGAFLGMGIQLAVTIVVLFFIGRWCDEQWGTAPWVMVGSVSIGIAGGLIKFIRTVNEISRREERDTKRPTNP